MPQTAPSMFSFKQIWIQALMSARVAAAIFAGLLVMAIANAEEKEAEKSADKAAGKPAEQEASKTSSKKSTATQTSKKPSKKEAAAPPAAKPAAANLPKDIKKLIIEDTIVGQGKVANKGKKIKVNYSGWLYDPSQSMGRGKQFDTSVGREPFEFTLGQGVVIKGWDEGFENMKVGGKRKLIIPPEMGYGDRGAGTEIPPNAALMFEVELIDVM